ncbi:hypothetical protein L195_g035584 [Trifolium pratense]|uniref:Uncharacterized protein n=1 Tax=Trifolium pratense TaxID=57577 RepID=A0A2K3LM27_TRIPR|nr:hypothetical protein L195_g035584 [Trifolium pratense]
MDGTRVFQSSDGGFGVVLSYDVHPLTRIVVVPVILVVLLWCCVSGFDGFGCASDLGFGGCAELMVFCRSLQHAADRKVEFLLRPEVFGSLQRVDCFGWLKFAEICVECV